MIKVLELNTISDFEALKKGDIVAAEWHRDVFIGRNRGRFSTYHVVENKAHTTEIILEKKQNIYFNYKMFIDGESNLKNIVLITHEP